MANMLAGADLIRRKEHKDAYVLTIPLLTTSDGRKWEKLKPERYGWIPKRPRPMILSVLA